MLCKFCRSLYLAENPLYSMVASREQHHGAAACSGLGSACDPEDPCRFDSQIASAVCCCCFLEQELYPCTLLQLTELYNWGMCCAGEGISRTRMKTYLTQMRPSRVKLIIPLPPTLPQLCCDDFVPLSWHKLNWMHDTMLAFHFITGTLESIEHQKINY